MGAKQQLHLVDLFAMSIPMFYHKYISQFSAIWSCKFTSRLTDKQLLFFSFIWMILRWNRWKIQTKVCQNALIHNIVNSRVDVFQSDFCLRLELRQYKKDSTEPNNQTSFEITTLFPLPYRRVKSTVISTPSSHPYIVLALAWPLSQMNPQCEIIAIFKRYSFTLNITLVFWISVPVRLF